MARRRTGAIWSRARRRTLIDPGRERPALRARPMGMLSLVRRSREEVVTTPSTRRPARRCGVKYPSPTISIFAGRGSHSTPLIVGNLLCATSTRKELFALNKATGRRWSHDFMKEYDAPSPGSRGYSCAATTTARSSSPWADQGSQSPHSISEPVRWSGKPASSVTPASPVSSTSTASAYRAVRWRIGREVSIHRTAERSGRAATRPAGDQTSARPCGRHSDHAARVSSAYAPAAGPSSCVRREQATTASEKWFSRRMRVHIGTVIRLGDYAYGSSGDFGPALHQRHRHENRQRRLAGSQFRARAAALRRMAKRSCSTRTATSASRPSSPQGLQGAARRRP